MTQVAARNHVACDGGLDCVYIILQVRGAEETSQKNDRSEDNHQRLLASRNARFDGLRLRQWDGRGYWHR